MNLHFLGTKRIKVIFTGTLQILFIHRLEDKN